jgi:hypothetical protein
MTNYGWIYAQACRATTAAALEQVIIDIKCDQFENEPYTKNESEMNTLREVVAEKQRKLSKVTL